MLAISKDISTVASGIRCRSPLPYPVCLRASKPRPVKRYNKRWPKKSSRKKLVRKKILEVKAARHCVTRRKRRSGKSSSQLPWKKRLTPTACNTPGCHARPNAPRGFALPNGRPCVHLKASHGITTIMEKNNIHANERTASRFESTRRCRRCQCVPKKKRISGGK